MTGIRKREMEFLTSESEVWVKHKILTKEQATKILGLYELKEYSLQKILLTAGGILLLLALVSFIAAHWYQLGKIFRVCVISAGYLASMGAYFFAGRSYTKTGRVLLLLASIIFGAGVYLITHMYDIKLTFSEVLGWWRIEMIVTALSAMDSWQTYFLQAVALVWLVNIEAVDVFALEFMGRARLPLSQFFMPMEAFAMLLAMWLVCRVVRDRTAVNINMLLTLLVLASRMSLCFGGTWTLLILACAGGAIAFSRFSDVEVLGLLLMGLCGLVLTWPEIWRGDFAANRSLFAVASAVVTGCIMLVNIWRGHGVIGVTFCVLLVVRYFFDHLFGYIPKAWGFGIAGAAFLIAGVYLGNKPKPEKK